jgi:hypothetical protein
MSFGLTVLTYTHVAISLVAIASGFVVLSGLLAVKRRPGWSVLFLATTAATSVTGFLFPVEKFLPSHAVGIVSLLLFPVPLIARYRKDLVGRWRAIYVITAMSLLYFNVFVLVAQAFQKIPPLLELAPTGSEPAFGIAQLVVLVFFIVATIVAILRFRKEHVLRHRPIGGEVHTAATA